MARCVESAARPPTRPALQMTDDDDDDDDIHQRLLLVWWSPTLCVGRPVIIGS